MVLSSPEFPVTTSEAVLPGQGCESFWQHIARCRELQMVGEVLPPPIGQGLVLRVRQANNTRKNVGVSDRSDISVTERKRSTGRAGLPFGKWGWTPYNKRTYDVRVSRVRLPSITQHLRKLPALLDRAMCFRNGKGQRVFRRSFREGEDWQCLSIKKCSQFWACRC